MDGTCSTHGRDDTYTDDFSRKTEETTWMTFVYIG